MARMIGHFPSLIDQETGHCAAKRQHFKWLKLLACLPVWNRAQVERACGAARSALQTP